MFKIVNSSSLIFKTHFKFTQQQVPSWATCDPYTLSDKNQHTVKNLVNGKWKDGSSHTVLVDPLNGQKFMKIPLTTDQELEEFVASANQCPKSGLFNAYKNPERFVQWGDLCFKIAAEMRKQEVEEYFANLIQRVLPKNYSQCKGEVVVTRRFFENFVGDNTRYIMEATQQSGDHAGQRNTSYRWPFGKVLVISPFNFPLEIPALQLFGALFTGNRPTLRSATKMTVVMEQFLRMATHLGMPIGDIDYINCSHKHTEDLVNKGQFRQIQFTGSTEVAERLCNMTNGKVKIEDAGFDWKILGPDVAEIDYVTYTSDQDAYAATGQKCSAQSICYVHKNWTKAGFMEKIKALAERRNFKDLTIGPVITWNNKQIQKHQEDVLKIPGARILFGGKPLVGTQIPECYGSYEPTAIYVPIEQISQHFKVVNTEVFGPFQIITEYESSQLDLVLEHLERQSHHLIGSIVSNDPIFTEYILSRTMNGVTYTGIRARTTGAPQNHFFGPSGDPRGAGIGTKEAIRNVWTHHREIVNDNGPIAKGWTTPKAT